MNRNLNKYSFQTIIVALAVFTVSPVCVAIVVIFYCQGCRNGETDDSEIQMCYGVEITRYFGDEGKASEELFSITIGDNPSPEQLRGFLLEIHGMIYGKNFGSTYDRNSNDLDAHVPSRVVGKAYGLFNRVLFLLAKHPDKDADKVLASLEYDIEWGESSLATYIHALSIRGESCVKLLKDSSIRKDAREVIRTGRW